MRVELWYFDGCPSWTVTERRLTQALEQLGRDPSVERRRVETDAEASMIGFTGSPTVRIDGRDPFATGDEQVALACRVYRTPEGLSGSPTLAQLIEVLR